MAILSLMIAYSIKIIVTKSNWVLANTVATPIALFIKGICIVNCIYVNPKTEQYWLIDYRIYDKTTDGKSKLDHLKDMLQHSIEHKQIKFNYVLMDTWYATKVSISTAD